MFRFAFSKDTVGGLLLILIGLGFLLASRAYNFGTLAEMGPGFFPMVLSGVLILIGLIVTRLDTGASVKIGDVPLRPLVAVLSSLAIFSLLVEPFGLLPAVFLSVFVAAYGTKTATIWKSFALSLAISVVIIAIFSFGLGLPTPIVRGG